MANLDTVKAYVATLTLDVKGLATAELAETLAAFLDSECTARDAAGVVKELRAVLAELEPKVTDDGDDDWTAPPAPAVRHAKGRKPRVAGSAGGRGGKAAGPAADAVAATRPRRGDRGSG